MIPVFITVRDLFDCPRNLARQVAELRGGLPVLCDNASTYPRTREWLRECDWSVSRGENTGNNVAWNRGLVLDEEEHERRYGSKYFVVTDGDVDLTECPVDLLYDMAEALEFTGATKVAVGLKIDDLPECNAHRDSIIQHESKFWKDCIAGLTCPLYNADADTHFCMYRAGSPWVGYEAVRMGHPYVARHVPWYWDHENLPEDAEWYVRNMNPAYSTWGNRIRHAKGWVA